MRHDLEQWVVETLVHLWKSRVPPEGEGVVREIRTWGDKVTFVESGVVEINLGLLSMSEVVLLGGPSWGRGVNEVAVEICKECKANFFYSWILPACQRAFGECLGGSNMYLLLGRDASLVWQAALLIESRRCVKNQKITAREQNTLTRETPLYNSLGVQSMPCVFKKIVKWVVQFLGPLLLCTHEYYYILVYSAIYIRYYPVLTLRKFAAHFAQQCCWVSVS